MTDTEMIFIIGALIGLMCEFKNQLDQQQLEILDKIDKKI